MAKPIDQVVKETLGNLMFQLCQAEVFTAALQEENAKLLKQLEEKKEEK